MSNYSPEVITCCCQRIRHWTEPVLVNDILHESPGDDRFCGPLTHHELRDLRKALAAKDRELAEVRRVAVEALTVAKKWLEHNGKTRLDAVDAALSRLQPAPTMEPKP